MIFFVKNVTIVPKKRGEKYVKTNKPIDWPRNNGEANLDLISQAVERFKRDPNYKNKEILLSLVDATDPNEIDERGVITFSDYEVSVINRLYLNAIKLGCESIKLYLYGYIARKTRLYKFVNYLGVATTGEPSFYIKEFFGLTNALKLFYLCYAQFNILKEKEFSEYLEGITKKAFYSVDGKTKSIICSSFTMLLYDLSFANSSSVFPYLSFNRKSIKSLFQLCAQLNKSVNSKANEHPLYGTLKIAIRQWILKSRNYNRGYIYKSISIKNIMSAYSNNQIWMSEISKLNDKREQKVIKELFAKKSWLTYDWAKRIKMCELKNSFVCSFSTQIPTSNMKKEYGSVTLGYKSDRIANLLAPTIIINDQPYFAQTVWYDVIYDREVVKSEINYLCDIINAFDLSDREKERFFEEILVYWYLSIKDKRWATENERRYQIFMNNNNEYKEIVIEDHYLKMHSSLYTYPDFIFTENETVKNKAAIFRKDKSISLMSKDYFFCNNCLQTNCVQSKITEEKTCPVCGSKNVQFYRGVPVFALTTRD